MDAEGERYAFTRLAYGTVTDALALIDLYSEELPLHVGYALLEYSVVKYFRPFRPSKTRHTFSQPNGSQKKQLALTLKVVPSKHLEFHQILSDYRDKAYAHFDLDAANVRPAYIKGFGSGFALGISPVNKLPLHIHIERMRGLYEGVAEQIRVRVDEFEKDYLASLPPDEIDKSSA